MRDMIPFFAIFNPLDLQSLIVLRLAVVAIDWSESIILSFCYTIAIMNLIIITTFFHKTCKYIFNNVLRARSSEGGFFDTILV